MKKKNLIGVLLLAFSISLAPSYAEKAEDMKDMTEAEEILSVEASGEASEEDEEIGERNRRRSK